ncbi:LysM peptidoglycan-binding domain-containing protein [Rossellomorea marisflavi]|uniref:LysM peptidoglycan-binding domain-containing protein n=1 Tax=Rossellomorea marisflavi TaxID=189381 RepID=UPI003459D067
MSKDPYREQAAKSKKKIDRVQEVEPVHEFDGLPSRSEIQRKKRESKKKKTAIQHPLIKLLLVFFFLMPIIFLSLYSYFVNKSGPLVVFSSKNGVEEVQYDQGEPSETAPTADEDKEKEQAKKKEEAEKAKAKKEKEKAEALKAKEKAEAKKAKEREEAKKAKEKEEAKKAEEKKQQEQAAIQQEKSEEAGRVVQHTVKPQETLYRIAMDYYQSPSGVQIISEANGIQDNEIYTGQVLTIPLNE